MDTITFIVTPDEAGGYWARAEGYSIFTQGDTLDDMREMIADAVQCHFEPNDMPRHVRMVIEAIELSPA